MIYLVSNQLKLFSDEFNMITIEESIELLDKLAVLAIDSETTGLDCHLDKMILLQLGNEEIQIVVDTTTIDLKHYKNLLETKDLIFQNAKFDLKFLYKVGIIPRGRIWDTMLAEQVLYNGYNLPSNLAYLVKKYCNVIISKSIREHIPRLGITNEVIKYAATDLIHLHLIKEQQIKKANKKGVITAINLENQFVVVLAYVEYCGIYLSPEKWKDKYEQAHILLKERKEALDQYILDNNLTKYIDKQLDLFSSKLSVTINWSSSQQVLPLFKDLGINVENPKNASGEGIAEKIIIKQKDIFPIIELYLDYQSIKKDFTTYGKSFLKHIHPVTGRIHSNFNQLMVTARLSSNDPNLQNLPRDERTRHCFIPQYKNNTLVIADYDAQEDKVFVNRSLEKNMIKFYNGEAADGHSYVAKLCFPEELKDKELADIKEFRPDLRYKAKTAKFAIHYSGNGYTISNNLNISEDEGNRIYNAYMKAFPDIAAYLKKQQNRAKKLGYILTSTVTGRKVWLPNFKYYKENGEFKKINEFAKLACNYPIQTESAEITKIAGIRFFRWILDNNLFDKVLISNLVHDEIMVENDNEIAETIAIELKKAMDEAGNYFCKVIKLTATPEITLVWKH